MEKLCSFIIGGDFNFDTRLISEAVQRKYGITIASVTIPPDITVYWVEPLDLEDESSENALLDHVPVVATLKLDRLVRTYKAKPFIKQDRGKLEQYFQSHTFRLTYSGDYIAVNT